MDPELCCISGTTDRCHEIIFKHETGPDIESLQTMGGFCPSSCCGCCRDAPSSIWQRLVRVCFRVLCQLTGKNINMSSTAHKVTKLRSNWGTPSCCLSYDIYTYITENSASTSQTRVMDLLNSDNLSAATECRAGQIRQIQGKLL